MPKSQLYQEYASLETFEERSAWWLANRHLFSRPFLPPAPLGMTDSERAIEERSGDYMPIDLHKENL